MHRRTTRTTAKYASKEVKSSSVILVRGRTISSVLNPSWSKLLKANGVVRIVWVLSVNMCWSAMM